MLFQFGDTHTYTYLLTYRAQVYNVLLYYFTMKNLCLFSADDDFINEIFSIHSCIHSMNHNFDLILQTNWSQGFPFQKTNTVYSTVLHIIFCIILHQTTIDKSVRETKPCQVKPPPAPDSHTNRAYKMPISL